MFSEFRLKGSWFVRSWYEQWPYGPYGQFSWLQLARFQTEGLKSQDHCLCSLAHVLWKLNSTRGWAHVSRLSFWKLAVPYTGGRSLGGCCRDPFSDGFVLAVGVFIGMFDLPSSTRPWPLQLRPPLRSAHTPGRETRGLPLSLCPGEIHPSGIRRGPGRTPEFPDSRHTRLGSDSAPTWSSRGSFTACHF